MTVKCPFCDTQNEIKGIFQDNMRTISGIICQNKECGQHLPEKFLRNRVNLFLRELLEHYYAGKYIQVFYELLTISYLLSLR